MYYNSVSMSQLSEIISGSRLVPSASHAIYAITASYALNSTASGSIESASYSAFAVSASYAVTASYAIFALAVASSGSIESASYALNASYALSASYAVSSSHTSMSMGDINDVSLTGLQDGYVLSYDSGQQKWVPTAMAAAVVSVFTSTVNSINMFSFNLTTTGIEVI